MMTKLVDWTGVPQERPTTVKMTELNWSINKFRDTALTFLTDGHLLLSTYQDKPRPKHIDMFYGINKLFEGPHALCVPTIDLVAKIDMILSKNPPAHDRVIDTHFGTPAAIGKKV